MKTKTLGLLTALASLLITGCDSGSNDSSSSQNNNTKPSSFTSSTTVDSSSSFTSSTIVDSSSSTSQEQQPGGNSIFGENYISVLNAPAVEARGLPTDIMPGVSGVNTYRSAFSTDPNTFDYLSNNKQTNSEYYANFVDNLLEHDQYGIIRGALAEEAAYSKSYKSIRFKLRKGVHWVDYTGAEKEEITADDFATGLQHLLDAKGGAETLAYYISGAKDYANGVDKEFSNVGFIKHGKYEFEYVLEQPTPFFHTFFEYTSFLPLNKKFFRSMGGKLGVEEWKSVSRTCEFGLTTNPEYLWYCGPYILTEYKKQTSLSMTKNPHYWDLGNVSIDKVEYVYNSGTNVGTLVTMFKTNQLSSLGVNSTNREELKQAFGEEAIFKQGTGTTTYYFNWNLNRQKYEVGASKSGKTTDAEKENTRKAILNENFRKAVFSAIPKTEMNARSDDAENAENCIRNTYTTPEFVSINKEITTSTGVKHAANSQYYEMVNKEMKKLNSVNGDDYAKYKSSYNKSTGDESDGSSLSTFDDSENSYYNAETAQSLGNKAKEELKKEGLADSAFPIKVDYLVYSDSSVMVAQAEILKERVNKTLKGLVEINIQTAGLTDYENSHFMAPTGADMNYDLSSGTGWGPDYGDPATFLSTLTWQGDLYNNLGLDNKPQDEEIYNKVLGEYQTKYDAAYSGDYLKNGVYDTNTRYAAFAVAEAELLSSAVIMPNTTDGGGEAISRIVPRTNQRAFYGTDDSRFKYMVLVDDVITKTQRDQIIADWETKNAALGN